MILSLVGYREGEPVGAVHISCGDEDVLEGCGGEIGDSGMLVSVKREETHPCRMANMDVWACLEDARETGPGLEAS